VSGAYGAGELPNARADGGLRHLCVAEHERGGAARCREAEIAHRLELDAVVAGLLANRDLVVTLRERHGHVQSGGDPAHGRFRERVGERVDERVASPSVAGTHAAHVAVDLAPGEEVGQRAGAISLYGYYGPVASGEPPSSPLAYANTNAPPCFVAHGDQDTLVIVEDARHFVEQLRARSSNPVVYAELPGAQHGFDMFRSRRFETVVDGIEAFAARVSSASAMDAAGFEPATARV
jgi:Dienelactone hydrolase family